MFWSCFISPPPKDCPTCQRTSRCIPRWRTQWIHPTTVRRRKPTILSDGRVDGSADTGGLGHVYASREILEEDLLVGGSGVDVDSAGTNGAEGRRLTVILYEDSQRLATMQRALWGFQGIWRLDAGY